MSRICILLTLIVVAKAYAQPGKLVKAGAPQPASGEGYHKGHCVALPNRIRICKLLSDNADVFLVEKEDRTLGAWPNTGYLGETDDFEVLRSDLDGDRQPELIVANRDVTSNGMGVSVWTIAIFTKTKRSKCYDHKKAQKPQNEATDHRRDEVSRSSFVDGGTRT